jgi:hypothetical protein
MVFDASSCGLEIVGRLVLSTRTVQNHVQNTLTKLQLHNKAQLVRFALQELCDSGGVPGCQVTEQRFDLVVRNGTIVTPGHREQADLGITGGRIAQLGGIMTGAGEIDAVGLLVIPGGIDAHVHLMCAQLTGQLAAAEPGEPVWADDFWTGSLAAIAGGITTVGNMTFALPGESMTQAVADGQCTAQPGQGQWVRRFRGNADGECVQFPAPTRP